MPTIFEFELFSSFFFCTHVKEKREAKKKNGRRKRGGEKNQKTAQTSNRVKRHLFVVAPSPAVFLLPRYPLAQNRSLSLSPSLLSVFRSSTIARADTPVQNVLIGKP